MDPTACPVRPGSRTRGCASPGHAWPVVVCSGTGIGQKGMLTAARILGASIVELLVSPDVITAAREEFERKMDGSTYVSPIPPGQKPPIPPGS